MSARESTLHSLKKGGADMDPFVDILLDYVLPTKHRAVFAVPVGLIFLALVFYGSHAIHTVMVAASFAITLFVFSVTLGHILRFAPPWLRILIATGISVACAVVAGQSASSGGVGAWANAALGFALGVVLAGIVNALGANFGEALPGQSGLGENCARVSFGLVFARIAALAPATTAAGSTALVGARGVAACVRIAASKDTVLPPVEAVITSAVGCIGFVAQTCCVKRVNRVEQHSAQHGHVEYEEI